VVSALVQSNLLQNDRIFLRGALSLSTSIFIAGPLAANLLGNEVIFDLCSCSRNNSRHQQIRVGRQVDTPKRFR
ncbi:hypothetical protein Ciccas_014137, partial [Cichlidogyrus casuarinus]